MIDVTNMLVEIAALELANHQLRDQIAALREALKDVLAEAALQDAFSDDEGQDIAKRAYKLVNDDWRPLPKPPTE